MGMSMGGGGSYNSEINVTPMVDVMLVLLIIFMVVTPLLQQGVTVAIPRDLKNPEEDPAIIKESSVVIVVTKDSEYYFGKEPIDKGELKSRIEDRMANKQPSERIVYIKSDINAKYGDVVEAINTIRQAGVDQIGLVADKKKGAAAGPTTTTAPATAS